MKRVAESVLVAVILAILAWMWAKIQSIADGLTIPKGAVIAFRLTNCPDGFAEYVKGRGRTIVGAGHGEGLSSRSLEDMKGTESVVLTIRELPGHAHGSFVYGADSPNPNGAFGLLSDASGLIRTSNTQSTGQNQAHENMPPFVALLYCEKQ